MDFSTIRQLDIDDEAIPISDYNFTTLYTDVRGTNLYFNVMNIDSPGVIEIDLFYSINCGIHKIYIPFTADGSDLTYYETLTSNRIPANVKVKNTTVDGKTIVSVAIVTDSSYMNGMALIKIDKPGLIIDQLDSLSGTTQCKKRGVMDMNRLVEGLDYGTAAQRDALPKTAGRVFYVKV